MDNGFIVAESYKQDGRGSKITIWRVVHPDQLEARRDVIAIMGSTPSKTRQLILKHKIKPLEPDHSFEKVVRQDYIDNFGVDPEDMWSGKQAPRQKNHQPNNELSEAKCPTSKYVKRNKFRRKNLKPNPCSRGT